MSINERITAFIDKPHGALIASALSSGPAFIEWLKSFTGATSPAGAITMTASCAVGMLILYRWLRNTIVSVWRDFRALKTGKDLDKE